MIKALAAIGGIILLATAWFHSSALGQMQTAIAPMDEGFFKTALPALWMMPSAHWIFIAFLSFGLSFYKSKAGAVVLIAFGVWVLVDAAIILSAVGPFIGAYMLLAAGVLILLSGVLLRRSMRHS